MNKKERMKIYVLLDQIYQIVLTDSKFLANKILGSIGKISAIVEDSKENE